MTRTPTEAKSVKLVRSERTPNTESEFRQYWEIHDHRGNVHHHTTRAGYRDEPVGRGLHKKYTVNGKSTTAREILGEAISTGGVTEDGEHRHLHDSHDPEYPFAFR